MQENLVIRKAVAPFKITKLQGDAKICERHQSNDRETKQQQKRRSLSARPGLVIKKIHETNSAINRMRPWELRALFLESLQRAEPA